MSTVGGLVRAANAFDVLVVLTLATVMVPMSRGWMVVVWTALVVAITVALRRGSRQRASVYESLAHVRARRRTSGPPR